tara:strand:+ start:105 stop:2195 length:2091 start_codon:yes stop_codon:yes gene_type:complete
MSWQTNFKDTAHYVPLTGEIRASKIQGEGRGYPDSVSGDADYVGNPTGIAKPEEMRMDDMRYRRMCFPDGRYPFQDFQDAGSTIYSGMGGMGGRRQAIVPGGTYYPAWAKETFVSYMTYQGPVVSGITEYNPFRGVSLAVNIFGTTQGSGPNNEPRWSYRVYQLEYKGNVSIPKPHRTQISYRKERPVEDNINIYNPTYNTPSNMATTGFAVNQIKYARGLNRTDNDWRPSGGGNLGMYGFGYSEDELGHSGTVGGVSQGLDGLNGNGDGPFNVPISDAGMIKFSDFRGKNKFYKTDYRAGKNEEIGSQSGEYPATNTTWNNTKLGNYVSPSFSYGFGPLGNLSNRPNVLGKYEFVGIAPFFWGHYTNSAIDGTKADGTALGARGYVNPDFGGISSPTGITLPAARGSMAHTTTLAIYSSWIVNSGSSQPRFKPLFASKSFAEPKNSATIGRYDSVTRSMPSYDYVNQGTGSVNRPPIVSNPRDGEMTHCIWYIPNQTGTGSWNEFGDLSTTTTSLPTTSDFPTGSDADNFFTSNGPNKVSPFVIEIGVLGRHHHSTNVLRAIYWNSGQYNTYKQGNTGNSSDENLLGGQFIDGTNCRAELDGLNEKGEIYYVSPNADNLYYGMTVWRSSFRVYRRDPYSYIPGYVYSGFGVPWSASAQPNPGDATRIIFESGDKAYDHITTSTYPGTDFNSPVGM